MPGQDKMEEHMKKMCFTSPVHKEEGQVLHLLKPSSPLPLPPLSNDQFIINLLTGRDSLSTGWLKLLFLVDFHPFS